MIKLWWPRFYLESYARVKDHATSLADQLPSYGVEPRLDPGGCNAGLCGSFWFSAETHSQCQRMGLPLFQYNWDLYPWQVKGEAPECHYRDLWGPYIEALKEAHEIWVPSSPVVVRTKEFTGREAHVMKCNALFYEAAKPDGYTGRGYVLDAMRKYPDPNRSAVSDACKEIGIPVWETQNTLSETEFREVVSCCSFIASGQYECSTGGLSLLEAYYLGKSVLLSDSLFHGGRDYFGDRASYFRWDDRENLKERINVMWEVAQRAPQRYEEETRERRDWLEMNYSEDALARRIARRLKEVL